jgi:D-alanine-D-alanine ligase
MFGGRSTEHEVSIRSAGTIFEGLEAARYDVVLIGIDHDGGWHCAEPHVGLTPGTFFGASGSAPVAPLLHGGLDLVRVQDGKSALSAPLDVIFPILHGREGEGGYLQGMLELARVPYVGSGVLGSALCMDKVVTKRVLRDAGIDVLPFVEHARPEVLEQLEACASRIEAALSYPVFVKPTVTGSSVGVHKVRARGELGSALERAAQLDTFVLAEPGRDMREIECAVLGGYTPEASVLGEIVPAHEFYDYEAKYQSDDTQLLIPASLPDDVSGRIRAIAVEAFRITRSWGMARVDFFVSRDGTEIILNELNSLPGFTSGSMYPLLWQASGLPLPRLIDRLIDVAIERQREHEQLIERYTP